MFLDTDRDVLTNPFSLLGYRDGIRRVHSPPPAPPVQGAESRDMEESKNEATNRAHVLFDRFVQATTCKGTLKAFQELCDHLELKPKDHRSFYHKLKSKLNYWKAKALWAKLDKRGSHKDYKKGKVCTNTKVGPGTPWRGRGHQAEVACEAG